MREQRKLVSAIAEVARRRDMTHIVLSPAVYKRYAKKLTKRDRANGVLNTRAHNAAILVIPGVPDHLLLSFSTKSRSQRIEKLLAAYRAEDWEEARTMMIELGQLRSRFVAVSRLPQNKTPD